MDPIPASNSKYFTEYEADSRTLTPSPITACEHYFVRTSGREIECKKCLIGFFVSQGDELKNGHLYRHGSQVI